MTTTENLTQLSRPRISCAAGGNRHNWHFGACINCGLSRRRFDMIQAMRRQVADRARHQRNQRLVNRLLKNQ